MLLVLALAVAPKQLLHDALTTHKHYYSSPSSQSHVNNYIFICDCENLVAESPFVDLTENLSFNVKVEYAVYIPHFGQCSHPADVRSFRLRGPPFSA